MRTRLPFPSLLLLGSLCLTAACSSGSSGVSDSATAGARPGPSSGASPARAVDPSKIKGLRIVNDNSENSSCPFATSYPDVPGATAMTDAMRKEVERRVASFRSMCDDSPTGADGGELNISHQFLVASGDVLGVRLTTQDRAAAGDGLRTRTYWYDGRAGAYRTALALVAQPLPGRLRRRSEGASSKGGTASDTATVDAAFADRSDVVAIVDDMTFTADGGLRVTFDRDEVGAAPAGRYVVAFSKATVTPWLSGFGKRAQRQTERPSRSLDLGASATPTPAVPTHTASDDDDTDCEKVQVHRPDLRRRPRRPGDRRPC